MTNQTRPGLRAFVTRRLASAAAAAFAVTMPMSAQASQPVPAAVPNNAARVTAVVRAHKVWSPAELANERPPVAAGTTLWSLRLDLLSATAAEAGVAQIAEAPSTVEAFSERDLPADLVGKKITATLTLTGGTDGARWFLTDFSELR